MALKRIGWVGYCEDKPYLENVHDDYGMFSGAELFKSKKEARKRFEDVRPVFVGVTEKNKTEREPYSGNFS